MSLTAKDVALIMQMLEASQFDHLSLEMEGIKLCLSRGGGQSPRPAPVAAPAVAAPVPQPAPAAKPVAVREAGLVEVRSPLLGVYYRAPKPGEAPFIDVGSLVEPDTVIGIVEVMKLMNSVRAGVSGEVVEILAPNGELVEFDEVLLLVRPKA
jgi:acetyl-CoA carboxylase biotin carboxyl carrier protein